MAGFEEGTPQKSSCLLDSAKSKFHYPGVTIEKAAGTSKVPRGLCSKNRPLNLWPASSAYSVSSNPTRDSFLGRQEGGHLRLTSDLCKHIHIHEHTQYVLFKPPMSGAFFFFKLFIFILHVWVFRLCVCMCIVYVQCPRRSEDGARPPETGGTDSCELPV